MFDNSEKITAEYWRRKCEENWSWLAPEAYEGFRGRGRGCVLIDYTHGPMVDETFEPQISYLELSKLEDPANGYPERAARYAATYNPEKEYAWVLKAGPDKMLAGRSRAFPPVPSPRELYEGSWSVFESLNVAR
jgi:hypothetical protein